VKTQRPFGSLFHLWSSVPPRNSSLRGPLYSSPYKLHIGNRSYGRLGRCPKCVLGDIPGCLRHEADLLSCFGAARCLDGSYEGYLPGTPIILCPIDRDGVTQICLWNAGPSSCVRNANPEARRQIRKDSPCREKALSLDHSFTIYPNSSPPASTTSSTPGQRKKQRTILTTASCLLRGL
jgi:hypothetical protein